MSTIIRKFDEKKRKQLQGLFGALGSDNEHEAEAARGRIESLLREFGKGWADIFELLGGKNSLRADLADDIVDLGDGDPEVRATARRRINDLLDRHRKTWNDLVNVLCATSYEAWACDPLADAPDRVNPFQLIHYLLEQYVVLEPHEYIAVSLWALHAHCYNEFGLTPRLALRSSLPNCGKTTVLNILERLTVRARKYAAITPAVLYHLIDQTHPTLLIDEVDNLSLALQANGRLRAIFNSGHENGGVLAILQHGEPREFSTFAPMALALPKNYGVLPRTLESRCITIRMKRQDGRRELLRFDRKHPDRAFDRAYEQILLWRQEAELNPDPEMPECNRFADNWRPLISIADSLGCGVKARQAMAIFARRYRTDDIATKLLIDIRNVFDTDGTDRLPSKVLLAGLLELEASEWCEFCGMDADGRDPRPHKLTEIELGHILRKTFEIRSCTIWPSRRTAETKSAKGYKRAQFEQVWRTFCDDDTAAQSSNIRSLHVVGSGTV
jgi:hypothetical protein